MATHASQCSCLENPRDGGAWWAAVYGVAQSRTRLQRLSSSSSYRRLLYPEGPLASPGSHQSGRRSCVTLSHPEPVNNSQEQNHRYETTAPVGIAASLVTSLAPTCALLLTLSFFSFLFCSLLSATQPCCHSDRRDRRHRILDRKAPG